MDHWKVFDCGMVDQVEMALGRSGLMDRFNGGGKKKKKAVTHMGPHYVCFPQAHTPRDKYADSLGFPMLGEVAGAVAGHWLLTVKMLFLSFRFLVFAVFVFLDDLCLFPIRVCCDSNCRARQLNLVSSRGAACLQKQRFVVHRYN